MRFVKQCRSCGLGVTVSSFKVGAAGVTDTIDLESCPGKKNPFFVPLFLFFYFIYFTHLMQKRKMTRTRLSLFCVASREPTHNPSLPSCHSSSEQALTRRSLFHSLGSFPWVSEPLCPLTPRVPWRPFHPVLAVTLSLFASHSAGVNICQHVTLACTTRWKRLIWREKQHRKPNIFLFFFNHFFVTQAIQSLFPRLPDSGRGTSLFDRGTAAAGPEGDKLRLDTYPFLGSGEFKDSLLVGENQQNVAGVGKGGGTGFSCWSSYRFLSLDACTMGRVHLSLSGHLPLSARASECLPACSL